MDFEDSIKEAAHRADVATREAMAAYGDETVDYEPVITGGLATSLRTALNGQIQDLTWSAHVLKSGTGSGREETRTGADLLIHVQFDTPRLKYSKGVLVQAKRVEPAAKMTRDQYKELVDQCNKMLDITAASFVFDYAKVGMRCAPAALVIDSDMRELYSQCAWTPYRFFLELFRSPIGDPKITSAKVRDLVVPDKLELKASRGL